MDGRKNTHIYSLVPCVVAFGLMITVYFSLSAQKSKSRSFILQLNYLNEQNKCEMYLFHQDKLGLF